MNAPTPNLNHSAVTGSAMDVPLKKKSRKKLAMAAGAAGAVIALAGLLWAFAPAGVQVPLADVRIATAQQGTFHDDVVVRATAAPLHSVILDSVESGRVEEVYARDGAIVKAGEPLFRLSNPQRQLELLARQTEHAQQISNMANMSVNFEVNHTDHKRRIADLEFSYEQAKKAHARNVQLAEKGFISQVALEESADKLAQQKHVLDTQRAAMETEATIKSDALKQMAQAIQRVQGGMQIMNATVDALKVRAAVSGRLTDFRLQVGETVKQDQHIGRIDDPSHFKLEAQVDEFYLPRVAVGRKGKVTVGDKTYAVEVSRVYQQIKEGRFAVELVFAKEQPATMNPGMSMDVQITLGDPVQALLLPTGAFLNDSGGAWVFVTDGSKAERREIRVGRRSNAQLEVVSGLKPGEKVIISSYGGYAKATALQLTK